MGFKLDNLHSKELDSQDPLKNFRDKGEELGIRTYMALSPLINPKDNIIEDLVEERKRENVWKEAYKILDKIKQHNNLDNITEQEIRKWLINLKNFENGKDIKFLKDFINKSDTKFKRE